MRVDFSYVMVFKWRTKLARSQKFRAWNEKYSLFPAPRLESVVWSGLVLARLIVFIRCQTNKVKVIVYVDTTQRPHRKEALWNVCESHLSEGGNHILCNHRYLNFDSNVWFVILMLCSSASFLLSFYISSRKSNVCPSVRLSSSRMSRTLWLSWAC